MVIRRLSRKSVNLGSGTVLALGSLRRRSFCSLFLRGVRGGG